MGIITRVKRRANRTACRGIFELPPHEHEHKHPLDDLHKHNQHHHHHHHDQRLPQLKTNTTNSPKATTRQQPACTCTTKHTATQGKCAACTTRTRTTATTAGNNHKPMPAAAAAAGTGTAAADADDDSGLCEEPYTWYTHTLKQLRELRRERDGLREQVSSLANFNYAREPEFVRQRSRLRKLAQEVTHTIRHLQTRRLEPVASTMANIEARLAESARTYEEESEAMAREFIEGSGNSGGGGSGHPQGEHDTSGSGGSGMHDQSAVDKFLEAYVSKRKEASKQRILADRLARECNSFATLATAAGSLG